VAGEFVDQPPGHARREQRLAGRDDPHRVEELLGGGVLEQERARTGAQRVPTPAQIRQPGPPDPMDQTPGPETLASVLEPTPSPEALPPEALAATLEGLLANIAIGFGSGDLVRAARLQRGRLAVDYACTWAERGAEVLALAILIFAIALLTGLGPLALVISGAIAAGYLGLLGAGRLLVPRLAGWPRVQRALSSGLQASTPRRVSIMVALSLLGWSCEIVMLVLFQRAFGLEPSFRTGALTLVGLNAAIVIPTLPGNFGTFEAGVATALILCGAPRDVAVSYAVTYHLSHVLPVAVVATALFLYRSRRYRTTPEQSSI